MMEIMSNFDHDNRNPRVLMHNALIVRRLSFSYHKLPKQLLKLSVLKLDGSSFGKLSILLLSRNIICFHAQFQLFKFRFLFFDYLGVEVSMNATVADLKLVLEEFFRFLPKEKRCIVSW